MDQSRSSLHDFLAGVVFCACVVMISTVLTSSMLTGQTSTGCSDCFCDCDGDGIDDDDSCLDVCDPACSDYDPFACDGSGDCDDTDGDGACDADDDSCLDVCDPACSDYDPFACEGSGDCDDGTCDADEPYADDDFDDPYGYPSEL